MGREGVAYFWYKTEEEEKKEEEASPLSWHTFALWPVSQEEKENFLPLPILSLSSLRVRRRRHRDVQSEFGRRTERIALAHGKKKRETQPDLDNVEEMFR